MEKRFLVFNSNSDFRAAYATYDEAKGAVICGDGGDYIAIMDRVVKWEGCKVDGKMYLVEHELG